MGEVALDASALLASLRDEPGRALVDDAILRGAVISAVNLAEVAGRLADAGIDPGPLLAALSLEVVPFDAQQAIEVGRLRPVTRALGLSLGDRACLALAKIRGLPALTADRAWASAQLGVEVRAIR